MSLISNLSPTHFYAVSVVIAVVLAAVLWIVDKRILSAATTGVAVFAAGCFIAAGYIMLHPTDPRWLPEGVAEVTPVDLPDVPFMEGATSELEGLLTQGMEYRRNYDALVEASALAGDFARTGMIAMAVFVVLWFANKLLKSRQTQRLHARVKNLERQVNTMNQYRQASKVS